MSENNSQEIRVYIGTNTNGDSEGIYVYRLNLSSGALEFESKATGVESPSFLALHPEHRYLYSVNAVQKVDGKPSGGVSAFRIDPSTGELTFLNQQLSGGPGPCHLSVDLTGQYVLVANYAGGSVAMLPIQADGSLGEATDFVQHAGSSVNPDRQQGPHAHSINIDPGNRYAFAPDLGIDKIMIYELDLTHGKLTPNSQPWAQVHAGAGPRHFDFHPNGRWAYAINELDSTMTAFNYDDSKGVLTEIGSIATLPDDFDGTSHCADVHVSPSGKFVYGSNRGHDSIVIFAVDERTGQLTLVGHESTQGEIPRNFAIDPTGSLLLAANQSSSTIVTFRIDSETGELNPTGQVVEVPTPVCLKPIVIPSN
jgi:6-phosphogluconolactonase